MKESRKYTPFLRQCFVTTAVCLNVVGHGCTLGYPGVLLPQLHSPGSDIQLTTTAESWITAAPGLALLVGNFITLPIMGRLGRKVAHLALCLPQLLGWILVILAPNVEVIIVGRILKGLSFGMLLPLRSPLLGEYTTPKHRGAFLTTIALSQAFGIFFVHLVGSLMDWQKTALVSMSFTFISLIMIIYSPESPSWLLSQGRYDECRTIFRWLRGDGEEEELEAMIRARILFEKEIESRKEIKVSPLRSTKEAIVKKEFYKPIILMFHLYFMSHFAGGTLMASYSTIIIGILMGKTANVHFWMVFLDGQRIFSNVFAIYIISKVKRRTVLFSVCTLCIASHVAISIYSYTRAHGLFNYDAIWLPVVLVNIHMFSVAVGMVPMPSILSGEVFPLEFRSIGNCISLVAFSIFFFICLKTFPLLISSIGLHGTYLIYSGNLLYTMIVCWFMLPETKGKTLQQIEDEYRGRPLSLEELESRQSLQMDPIEAYKRKMSERRCSSPIFL